GQRPAGGEVAAEVDGGILADFAGAVAGDQRQVVGAVDGDGDDLAGGAVADDGCRAVGERLAGGERLDGGLAVVGRVAPAAVGGRGDGAIAFPAGGGGVSCTLSLHDALPIYGQRPAGGEVAAEVDGGILADFAGAIAGDQRQVVGAVDGDGDD